MLSEQDIADLRAALEANRPATVWFTAKAVGVESGKSGKVLSFAEPAEGDFIEVKPTGSQDTLSFSPAELTLTRPKRQPAPKKPAPVAPVAPDPVEIQEYRPEEVEKPTKPKAKPAARRMRTPTDVTVTLHATPRGEWTVEVVAGGKRTIRARPIPAVTVLKAAKELPEDVAGAIGAVLDAARDQHRERINLLQAELDAARRALDELS
ncbi:hypothetical protein GCM10029964_026850 [Kibdelosporangium lantanae]